MSCRNRIRTFSPGDLQLFGLYDYQVLDYENAKLNLSISGGNAEQTQMRFDGNVCVWWVDGKLGRIGNFL